MKYTQPRKIYGLIILIALATALHGCAAKPPETAQGQGAQVLLNKIEPRDMDGKTEINIEGTEPILQYTSFQLTEPLRLVVDISDADVSKFHDPIKVNSGAVTDITPSQKDNIARLEIGLSQAADTKVYQSGGKLIVELSKPVEEAKTAPEAVTAETTTKAEQAAPTVETAAAPQSEQPSATVVSSVKASAGKDGVKVVIAANGSMKPNTFMVEGKKLVVDIPGVRSRVRPSVIPVRKGGLDKVRVGQHAAPDQKVRIVMDLTKTLSYTVTPEGNKLIIAMSAAAVAPKTEEKQPQERAATQEPEKAPPAEKEMPAPQPAVETVAAPPAKQDTATQETAPAGCKFPVRKVHLDFQDADLVNVLRLFADIANLNVILAPEVRGKVTVRLVNIPFERAIDTILKMNNMGYRCDDNILRIASVGALTKEDEDEARAKEAKKKAEDLVTRIIPINYSTADQISGTIKKSLSPRGDTVIDARTNTLIVKDLARNIEEVVSMVKLLDKPIPQIMIEARIVEASTSFSRDIGIQWGGKFNADSSHGNATGSSFPNSVTMTGGPSGGSVASGNGNYLVNMPASAGAGGGGSIGFTFGSINKALNLDLVLTALESSGEGKIISQPRVNALDNKQATITQGTQIPYPVTSASGANTQMIAANLSLNVTPHATPDNKIFLTIHATKNAPGSILGSTGLPSIDTNEATTDILLADGETAVIGGILSMSKSVNYVKVPFFGDLPLIGWLFKKKTSSENKKEMLIFVTPRIVKQEVM